MEQMEIMQKIVFNFSKWIALCSWRAPRMSNYLDQALNGLHFHVVTLNAFVLFCWRCVLKKIEWKWEIAPRFGENPQPRMNPNFAILLLEAWTFDPSTIYYPSHSEIWALASVKRKKRKRNLQASSSTMTTIWEIERYRFCLLSHICIDLLSAYGEVKARRRTGHLKSIFGILSHTSCAIIELRLADRTGCCQWLKPVEYFEPGLRHDSWMDEVDVQLSLKSWTRTCDKLE